MSCENTVRSALDLTPFVGDWINTNEGLREIDRVSLRTIGDHLYLRVRGSSHPAGADWGEIKIESVYSDLANLTQATSFIARYDFELLRVEIGVNLNQGLSFSADDSCEHKTNWGDLTRRFLAKH
jgi:hypothetical protein